MRLEKYLSDCGVGSRREIKALIKSGRAVEKDGDVFLDGKKLEYSKYRYFAMNKPKGCVCANEDRKDGTVFDYLDKNLLNLGLFTVGRLDKNTTGLLLLTNDGDFAHKVISPKSNIYKLYYAVTDGSVTDDDIIKFKDGIAGFLPAELRLTGENECEVLVREGKYHQVKRMLESVGKSVIELKRLKIGQFSLPDGLDEGQIVELSQRELAYILNEI